MSNSSEYSGFHKLPMEERSKFVKHFSGLTDDEIALLVRSGSLAIDQANRMIENVIGVLPVPFGIAMNFLINNQDYLVPMAIEEPSVVAAASNSAKVARIKGGFFTSSTGPIMIAQIQAVHVPTPFYAKDAILAAKDEILSQANEVDPLLVKLGGGALDINVRIINTDNGPAVVTHLIVDSRDAMGANAVNTMAEKLAPRIEYLTRGKVYLRILSNLADRRLVRARAVFDKNAMATNEFSGDEVVYGIIEAYQLAKHDPYRAATHNKGIMNGITAVVLATGNDTRAIEAGAHTYAWSGSQTGQYSSLTVWEKNEDGDLVGTIEVPMAVGLVGGATAVHPIAKIAVKILKVKTATELGEVIAAVGLAQNHAALRALATYGVQKGHMALHAKNVATSAGAVGDEIDRVAQELVKDGKIRVDHAAEVLERLKN